MKIIKLMTVENHLQIILIKVDQEQLTAEKGIMMDIKTQMMSTKTPNRTLAQTPQALNNLAPALKVLTHPVLSPILTLKGTFTASETFKAMVHSKQIHLQIKTKSLLTP
jgi:hypothetical protein